MVCRGGGIAAAALRSLAGWLIAVVIFLVPGAAAAAVNLFGAASGAPSSGGGTIALVFSCTGAPTCTGTYMVVLQDSGCSNPIVGTGAFTMTLSSDLSAPGPVSGSATAANAPHNSHNSNGTCSEAGTADATLTFTGSWDGTAGSITFSHTDSDGTVSTLPGAFTLGTLALASAQVSGSFGGAMDGGGSVQGSFTCVGSPICSGTYSAAIRNSGCSNTFSVSGSIVFSGFDLSGATPLGGTVVLQNAGANDTQNPDGTCTIKSPGDAALTYTGSYSAGSGTLQFVGDHGTTIPGTFSANVSGSTTPSETPPFQMTVTSNITPTAANASAQFVPAAADIGKTESVYVFAFAPRSLVKSAPAAWKDDTNSCVLAQLDASGNLHAASASNLSAYTTGVLSAQGQSVSILNNISTPSVAGATFFLGYGPDSGTMISQGVNQTVVQVPGAVQCPNDFPTLPGPLSGLWWGGSAENGWGIGLTQRENHVFAAWYMYDASGNAKWYVASDCSMAGANLASGRCTGTLYDVSGAPFFGTTFNPGAVHATAAGNMQADFTDPSNGTLTFTLNGVTRTLPITRQVFRTGTAPPTIDYTDLWWGGSGESGWGLSVSQQYDVMFLAWFVYDANGKPTWYVATDCAVTIGGNGCSGALYHTSGPPFGPTFDPSRVQVAPAGTVSVTFTDPNHGTLDYTVGGVTASKQITRQIF